MPIHVHMITQVRPKIGIEWKFLYILSASVAMRVFTSTYLQLLALSQSIHVLRILARAAVSIEGAVAALGAHVENRLLLDHCGDKRSIRRE